MWKMTWQALSVRPYPAATRVSAATSLRRAISPAALARNGVSAPANAASSPPPAAFPHESLSPSSFPSPERRSPSVDSI